jgi:hypothetical protein
LEPHHAEYGTSRASGVGQFGNTIGIGKGNLAGLDGLLALNFSDDGNLNLGNAETGASSELVPVGGNSAQPPRNLQFALKLYY